jgi:nucleoside-diphosphate-sugar epimerase
MSIKNKIKILILGGTQMVGRDFVETIKNDIRYDIHIANRGLTNSEIFPNIKKILIDRNSSENCQSLSNKYFDIIVDFSCYNLSQFLNTIKYVQYKYYILISSTCSSDPRVINDPSHLMYRYCKDKQHIEEYILKNSKNVTIIRPCIIYGKYDYTNRFYEKNNKFYFKNTNQLVESNEYYIYIKDLSKWLYVYICQEENLNFTKIIKITGNSVKNY